MSRRSSPSFAVGGVPNRPSYRYFNAFGDELTPLNRRGEPRINPFRDAVIGKSLFEMRPEDWIEPGRYRKD